MNVLNRQNRRIQRKLANLKNLHPLWVRTVAGLAAVVMFFTVYSLILPAAAATGDQATEESGFFLEESAAETETKELAEAEPASGGEAAQEAESPSGSSAEGSAVQQESGSSAQPETLQAETSSSGSGWESIPQDKAAPVEAANGNTDNVSSTASGSGQNGTEEFVVSEQETNKSTEAAVTEEIVSETASPKTEATTEEITEETSEELSDETEEEEEEPVYTNTIETEDEKTGIKAKIVFDEEIVRDTDKLVLAAASDKKSDKEIVIPLDALEKGIAERCAEIVNKDLDDEEKKSADDIETVKAEFVGLTIEDKDGEEVSLPANTRMRVEIVFPGSYETEDEEYQCVLMAEQSAKDYQDQLEKKVADDELVVSMEKLKADVSEQDEANGGKTVVSFETKELNSAGIVVFRVSEDDVEEASSDESEVSEESSETSEEISDETAETSEEVTDESSEETSESKETVSEDALAEVSAESADEVTSESEEAASEEDATVYEASTLKADGGDYHVTMSYAEDAKIPAGARLEVRELQERTREFNKLIGQYNKEFPDAKIETESSSAVVRGLKKATDAVTGFVGSLFGIEKAPEPTSVQTARLFDITILDENGKEIEPSGTVQVDIQLDALQQVASESDVTLVHFEDKVNEVDASLSGETLSFETDSFSVYGVVYTVDFEYSVNGKMYQFSLPGGEKIALSDLIEVLGIIGDTKYESVEAFLANVDDVKFSNPELVTVNKATEGEEIVREVGSVEAEEQLLTENRADSSVDVDMTFTPSVAETIVALENDWILTSLQPFSSSETLKISLADGTDYVVDVTDDYDTITGMPIALEDYATITATINGSTVVNDAEREDSFTIKIGYSFDTEAWSLIKQYIRQNPGTNAVVLEYDFSDALKDSAFAETIAGGTVYLTTATGKRIGTMTVDPSGKAIINLANLQYLMGQSSARGNITFEVVTDESKLGDDDSTSITFPGTTTPLEVNYKDKITVRDKTLTKTENADGSYTLSYTAAVTTTDDLTTLNFVDSMTGDQTLDLSSVKVNGNSVSVTQTNDGFTLDMVSQAGSGGTLPAGTYTVTYSTTVSKETLDALTEGGSTSGTNSATWKAEGDKTYPGGSTEYTINKPTTPVPVEKNVDKTSASGGDTVTYTITYGDSSTPLAGFRILDNITDVYTDYSDITVSYNGISTTLSASSAAADDNYSTGSITLFDYTFPSDTVGYGPVTVTYSAKLIDNNTAKANNIYGTVSAVNTAQEGKNWTTDGTTTVVEYPEEPIYSVSKTAVAGETDEEGNWQPGSTVTYTIVINADQSADMSGVVLSDVMTDLQKLTGDITISYGSTTTTISAGSGATDSNYSTGTTTAFNYTMPSDAGNVAVTITYTTTIADTAAAAAAGVYGSTTLSNTASAGSSSDGTSGTVPYPEIPIKKEATYSADDTNTDGNLTPGSTIHYTITYGSDNINNDGVTIQDQMTDIQKLTGSVTITLPKLDNDVTWSDGTVWTASATQKTYTMPIGSSAWANDGLVWEYFSDGSYNVNEWARVFNLKLPDGIGAGEITVEYDVEVISEEEALANGIIGLKNAQNQVTINGKNASTTVPVQFEEDVDHNPALSKSFAEWDLENQLVYWYITVEAAEGSAYPLTDITVREVTKNDQNHTWIKAPNEGVYYYQPDGSEFDVLHAVVTTESGDVLQPGVDYSIDKTAGTFTFPELTEKITIRLAYKSPYAITNGYYMYNEVRIDNIFAHADQTYNTTKIDLTKYGAIADEENRIIKWTVTLNSSKLTINPDTETLAFSDTIPEGLVLVNFNNHTDTSDPSIKVSFSGGKEGNRIFDTAGRNYNGFIAKINYDTSTNVVSSKDISARKVDWSGDAGVGLSGTKYVVEYYTKITDEEFAKITSSLTGSETFNNDVTFTTDDGTTYDVTGDVTYEYDRYVIKTDETSDPNGYVVDAEGIASNVLSYKIQINPDALTLNSGSALTLTDYIDTNMDLLTDTVKLSTNDGTVLSYSDMIQLGINIAYDDDTRYLTISGIPDQTAYNLTYDAQAKGKGTDTFSNTAVLVGGGSHSSTVEKEHTVQMVEGSFATSGVSLGLKKVDQNNITKSLEGAKFELYKYTMCLETKYTYQSGRTYSAADSCDNPWLTTTTYNGVTYYVYDYVKIEAVRNGTYTGTDVDMDLLKEDFEISSNTKVDLSNNDTTDSRGELTFGGLEEWAFYYWIETEAPEDYAIYSSVPHNFVLYSQTDGENNYSTEVAELHYNIAKAIDHAATIANGLTVATYANEGTWVVTNIEQEYTSVSVAKVWEGDFDDFYETRPTEGIQVNLYQIDAEGNETLMSDLSPVSLNVAESGYWNNYTWDKLPATYTDDNGDTQQYKYTVKEVELSDYSTTYSDNGEGVVYGIVTVTNTLIPTYTSIHVKKEFADGVTEYPEQILVSLYVIRTDSDGVSADLAPSGYTGALTASGNWSFSWDKLPTKDDDGNKLTYTVVEDLKDLEDKGFSFIVTYSDDNKGVLSSTQEDPLVITNSQLEDKTTFEFNKIWLDSTGNVASSDTYKPWQTDITVTIGRRTGTTEDSNFVLKYTIAESDGIYTATLDTTASKIPEGEGTLTDLTLTGSVSDNVFNFKLPDESLKKYNDEEIEWVYYVVEEKLDDYAPPAYGTSATEESSTTYSIINGASDAEDGGVIVNQTFGGYELPSTGGPGTRLFTILGSILILGAGVLLWRRRRTI